MADGSVKSAQKVIEDFQASGAATPLASKFAEALSDILVLTGVLSENLLARQIELIISRKLQPNSAALSETKDI